MGRAELANQGLGEEAFALQGLGGQDLLTRVRRGKDWSQIVITMSIERNTAWIFSAQNLSRRTWSGPRLSGRIVDGLPMAYGPYRSPCRFGAS